MVSVTSEALANVSFQGAPARSARPDSDHSAGNDSFAALVDNNAAASNADNRAQDASPRSARPRRADDSQGRRQPVARQRRASDKVASDKARIRQSDRADARNNSDDRDAAVTARNGADADAKSEATRRSKSKSASSKSDARSPMKRSRNQRASATDGAAATDQTEAKQDATAEVTANAIATVIPVATATRRRKPPPRRRHPTRPTAPLAIAAAAIAATASLTGTAAASRPAPTLPRTPAATAGAAKTNGAKTDAQATVGEAVTAPAVSADAPASPRTLRWRLPLPQRRPARRKPHRRSRPKVVAKEGTASVRRAGQLDRHHHRSHGTAASTIVPAVTPQAEVAGKAEGRERHRRRRQGRNRRHVPHPHASRRPATVMRPPPTQAKRWSMHADNSLQAAGAIQTQQPAAPSTTPAAAPQLNVTAATAQAAVPLSGLAMEIAASAKSGKSRFEIRLDPADLGRIDVRIDVDRNGQVTSHLTVERPETLSMLRQDANQLQRALDNAGLSTGNSGLQFSLRDQSSQGQNDDSRSNPNAHRLIVSEEDTIPAAVAGRSYGRMLGSSSGVDIRV